MLSDIQIHDFWYQILTIYGYVGLIGLMWLLWAVASIFWQINCILREKVLLMRYELLPLYREEAARKRKERLSRM